MFSLTKTVLPSTISVGGSSFRIKTDFHYWLQFYKLIKHKEIENLTDIDFMFDGKKPADRLKGYEELLKFLTPEKELPRATGRSNSGIIVYDYETDAEIIFASFMEQYGIDLFESRMHWWKFLALFEGLHGTRFNEIVSYRCYSKNDHSTAEQTMEELKNAWSILPETSEDVQKDLEAFNSLFD